jgi:hypothetical protein
MDDPFGATGFRLSLANNASQRELTDSYSLDVSTVASWNFIAPITTSSIRFSFLYSTSGQTASAIKTTTSLPIGSSFTFFGSVLTITRVGENRFNASLSSGYGTLEVQYTATVDMAKINFTGANNVLWNGVSYMGGNDIAELSESVLEQLTGIVLVWSETASGSAVDYGWYFQYVPKEYVVRAANSSVNAGLMLGINTIGTKWVFGDKKRLVGSDANLNTAYQITNNLVANNKHWVLRYVIGV